MGDDLACYQFVDNKKSQKVANMHRKAHLPSKICIGCDKPFTWRKKWQHCWEQVRYCSKRCSSKARGAKKSSEC